MKPALIAALIIAAAASACYTRHLDKAPPYLQHDEVNFAIQAHALATTGRDVDGNRLPLYFAEPGFNIGRDPLYIYAAATSLRILPWRDSTLRLPTTIAAVITVFLIVLTAYELFGSVVAAVVAGVFLATTPALFIHGRKALSVVYPLPFVTAWLLFVLRYERTNRVRDLIAAIASLGLALYGYMAMVVLVPVYAVATLVIVAVKKQWRHLPHAGLALAAIAAPLLIWQLTHPGRVSEIVSAYGLYDPKLNVLQGARDVTSWFSISMRADIYWRTLNPGPLFFSGESVLTDSTRQAGTFPFVYLGLLPAGVAYLLRKPVSARSLVVMLGLITAPLPAVIVAVESLYRFLVIVVFAALVATAGFMLLWSRPRLWSRSLAIGVVVMSLWMFHGFHRYYLTEWPVVAAPWFGGNIRGAVETIVRMPRADSSGLIYLSSRVPYIERYFELYRRLHQREDLVDRVRGLDVTQDDWRGAPAASFAIVAANDATALAALTSAAWRQAGEVRNPDERPAFLVFSSPR